MTGGGWKAWRGLGCAALVGASIAFPLGMIVGGNESPRAPQGASRRPAPAPGKPPTARNPYSPRVAGDPYVLEQQRRVVRALEASCRESGQHCAEAEQARLRIQEAEAAR